LLLITAGKGAKSHYCFTRSFEFGSDLLIFHEVMALGLRKKSRIINFPHFFFALLTDIHLIFGILLCNTKIQIKFEFGFNPLIFHEVMALGLRKKYQELLVFRTFSLSAYRYIHLIFGTLFCHTKIQIKCEFGFDPLISHEAMTLGLRKKITNNKFSGLFLSLLTDIHLIFGTLFCHTKLQMKFKFVWFFFFYSI
jgi:hypothetical protein